MENGVRYVVEQEILLHTQPNRTLVLKREGVLVKETEKSFIFDSFKVRKSTVIGIWRASEQ